MALEHALLVALSERPAAGLELARRFDRSIGFFWSATHQQIYKVLRRMESDGLVTAEAIEQTGRPEKREYTVTDLGRQELGAWIATTTPRAGFRSEIAVKMRAASYGDRAALLANIRELIDDHRTRLAHYDGMAARDYPDTSTLSGQELDTYLVLRGGILQETFWIAWLTEYLEAHGVSRLPSLAPQPAAEHPLAPQPAAEHPLAPQPAAEHPLAPRPATETS